MCFGWQGGKEGRLSPDENEAPGATEAPGAGAGQECCTEDVTLEGSNSEAGSARVQLKLTDVERWFQHISTSTLAMPV